MLHPHAPHAAACWPPASVLHLESHSAPPAPRRPGDAAPALRPAPPARHLFGGVTSKRMGARAARRGAFTTGATILELLLGAAVVTVPLATPAPAPTVVAVKIVRAAAPPPQAPPPPAAAPARPRDPAAPRPAPAARRPLAALIQPRELPADLAPAVPAAAPEDADEGGDPDGVVGGVVGYSAVAAAAVAVAPPPAVAAPPRAAPVKFDDRMTAPALLHAPPLEYTQQALEHEVQGEMKVACVVDLEGRVASCRVLRGLPFLERSVLENLQARRYRPATLGGEPLTVEYVFTVKFQLPD